MAPAAAAFRVALLAGARSAAAEEAVRRLDGGDRADQAPAARVGQALAAVVARTALRERELVLEQAEQEDGVRHASCRCAELREGGGLP